MPETTHSVGHSSGVTAHLRVNDGRAAVAWYAKAFGAKELLVMPAKDGKRLMHAQLEINGGHLMLADEFPEFGGDTSPPTGVTLHLQVEDADAVFNQAVAAGAVVAMPLDDMFWGDRYGQLTDPFGHRWSIAATIKKA